MSLRSFLKKEFNSTFSKILWQTFFVFVLLVISFVSYVYFEHKKDAANELRMRSFLLTDEFHQSSDDLKRMVRTYITTGNPIYKQRYHEILDIRDGKKPRPADYQNVYLGKISTDDRRPRPFSDQSISLIDLMKHSGFTDQEFDKLDEAKKISDTMNTIELQAMDLVDTKLSGSMNNLQKQKALEMISSDNYEKARTLIVQKTNEFSTLIDKRTAKMVHDAILVASVFRILFIILGVFFIFMLWRLYKYINTILGSNVTDVHKHIIRIGSGDFSVPIRIEEHMKDSVLGLLSEMQTRLEHLIQSNERLKQLYAVLSQCNQAIVRSKNRKELFDIICQDAVSFGGMQMAWIGIPDKDNKYMEVISHHGNGSEYLNDIKISIDPSDQNSKGPTGTAFIEGKPFWCHDFRNNPRTAPWHEKGKKFGWASSAALPLHIRDKVVGVFTIYSKDPKAFDKSAQMLLEEMAVDISYALEGFELEKERKVTESALADNNSLLTSIIDNSPVRIFWKDKNLTYLGCNQIFAQDAGEIKPEDIIGKNDKQLCWSDEEAEKYQADDLEVIRSGKARLFFEESQTNSNGDTIWLSTSKVPLYNRKKETIGIVGIYEEITARKNAEIALLREKEAVQNYLDIVGVMILVLDTNKNVKLINRQGCEIIGYEAEEVIGKNWIQNFIPKKSKKDVDDLADKLIKKDKLDLSTYENPVLTKSGEERLILWNNTPLFDENGKNIGILTSGEDITERRASEKRIHYLANYDGLTGLPNRTQLDIHIKDLINFAKRDKSEITVIFLDLDHFKDINDSLGHSTGDDLLISVAKRLRLLLREVDTISRMGGDEFVILLPDTTANGATIVTQKIIDAFNKPFHIADHELSISASIGIAMYPHDGEDFETLYKNADTAMYRAKKDGRNTFCFFTQEMQENSIRHLELSNALRYAIERDQLELHYQPQFSTHDNVIIGAEALLRWNHPEFGKIPPDEFIPIAEESGIILSIGEWVLREATKSAKQWIDDGMEPIIISVNLSAVQFRSTTLTSNIIDILNEVELPIEYLELELTESVAMQNPQRAINIINELHTNGIKLSIDDFGTGYSSLSYLKRFSIYKLKIDQSFVRDITIDPEDKAIVNAIISLAKSLGLKTIAEGVETIDQLDYLTEQGCDEIQGYFFSRPLPKDEFELFRKNITTYHSYTI
ncbi:MAG: EAL domain-containing protein [Sulfurospirillaceae bacterium]|nr:EAL domain-containing protein [Sulfurospirillaceae bacterium]